MARWPSGQYGLAWPKGNVAQGHIDFCDRKEQKHHSGDGEIDHQGHQRESRSNNPPPSVYVWITGEFSEQGVAVIHQGEQARRYDPERNGSMIGQADRPQKRATNPAQYRKNQCDQAELEHQHISKNHATLALRQ